MGDFKLFVVSPGRAQPAPPPTAVSRSLARMPKTRDFPPETRIFIKAALTRDRKAAKGRMEGRGSPMTRSTKAQHETEGRLRAALRRPASSNVSLASLGQFPRDIQHKKCLILLAKILLARRNPT